MNRLEFIFKAVNAIMCFTSGNRTQPRNEGTRVAMYTLSICPSCKKAKRFFADHHIPFQETNYDLADQATQDKIGHELERDEVVAFPFVRIGEHRVQGYDPERYAKLLGISI